MLIRTAQEVATAAKRWTSRTRYQSERPRTRLHERSHYHEQPLPWSSSYRTLPPLGSGGYDGLGLRWAAVATMGSGGYDGHGGYDGLHPCIVPSVIVPRKDQVQCEY